MVVRILAAVRALGNDRRRVDLAVLGNHLADVLCDVDHAELGAGRRAEIGHRRRRKAADPEEGVDLLVLDRVDALGDAEALTLHVLVLVETGGLDDAECEHLGGAAGRTRGDALALEILDLGDAGAVDGHDVHMVRIHDDERLDRQLAALELVETADGIPRGVDLREGDVGAAGADELQVGNRAAGHFRRCRRVRDVLADDAREPAAERIVHAARATRGDRELLGLRDGVSRGEGHSNTGRERK